MSGKGSSSRLSAWLANGSLSVRHLYHKIQEFKRQSHILFAPKGSEKYEKLIESIDKFIDLLTMKNIL